MEEEGLIATEAKVWLLAVYSLRLPRALLREISTYIGAAKLLMPLFSPSYMHLFDLQLSTSRRASIPRSLSNWSFCHISEIRVLCVGFGSRKDNVYSLRFSPLELARLPPMSLGRLSPGLVKVGRWVYVFGGSTEMDVPSSSSCERFDYKAVTWQLLPNMLTAKARFQPCSYLAQVYLCCPACNLEVFDTLSMTFSQINICFQAYTSGSLSFLIGDTVHILSSEKRLIRWKIGCETWSADTVHMESGLLAVSKCVVVVSAQSVYWTAGDSEVIQLDLDKLSVREVTGN